MQKNSYLLFIGFLLWSSVALPTLACTSEPPSERYYVTYFDAHLASNDTTLYPCYLDARLLKPYTWDTPPEQLFATNLTEWKYFCQNQPSLTDIWEMVYALPLEAFRLQNGGIALPDSVNNNSFVQYLRRHKADKEVLPYLHLLKQSEQYTQSFQAWETDSLRNDLTAIRPILSQLKANYATASSDFLKLRYAYIALRLARSSGAEPVASLYDTMIEPLLNKSNIDPLAQKSKLQYWAMALKAGTLLETDNATALYLFAKCFLNDPEKRELYLFNFNIYDDASFEKALQLAKTADEKATLWLMYGSRITALDSKAIESLYAAVPSSPFLNLLLVREVNKIERYDLSAARVQGDSLLLKKVENYLKAYYQQKYGEDYYAADDTESDNSSAMSNNETALPSKPTQQDGGFFSSIGNFFNHIFATIASWFGGEQQTPVNNTTLDLQDADYIRHLLTFVAQTAREGKVADVALWQTTAAYLHYLLNENEAARDYVAHLNNAASGAVRNQALLVDMLVRLNTDKIDETLENDLTTALHQQKMPLYEYDNYGVASRILSLVAQKYWQQGQLMKAILCFDKAKETTAANKLLEFVATQQDLDQLLARIDATNHTAFERFLLDKSRFTHDVVIDIQATKLMQQQQFEAALSKYLQLVPDYFPAINPNEAAVSSYDPTQNNDAFATFSANFEQNPSDKQRSGGNHYNRKTFAQKAVDLLKKAKQTPAKADECYYQLANGLQSTPFWAYNSRIWEGGLVYSFYDNVGSYPLNLAPQDEQLWEAEQAFWKRYGTQAAAIQFYDKTIASTKNNELAAKSAYLIKYCQMNPPSSIALPDTTDMTYTRLLSQKYANTQFYSDILRECPNLSAYIGK